MELTKEQLQKIDYYLVKKEIDYIDLKDEVFDHITSDIENSIVTEDISFEDAFKKVSQKWNAHFVNASSFYFGIMYPAPKIVIEKAKNYFKKWFLLSFIIFLLPNLIINQINTTISEGLKNGLNLSFQILTILSFIIFIYLLINKPKSILKSTYGFILKTQSLNILIGGLLLIDFEFFNKNGNLDGFKTSLLVAFIFFTIFYYHFYKKHKEVIKKHKIS